MTHAMSTETRPPRMVDEVRDEIHQDDRGKWDMQVDRSYLTMRDGALCYPPDFGTDYPNDLHPTSWAVAQMCGKLGIPTAYFRRCPKVLRDIQFNYWIRRPRERDGNELIEDEAAVEAGTAPVTQEEDRPEP